MREERREAYKLFQVGALSSSESFYQNFINVLADTYRDGACHVPITQRRLGVYPLVRSLKLIDDPNVNWSSEKLEIAKVIVA